MKRQICNHCGQPLRLLDAAHIFQGKVVCPRCIKALDPKSVKPKVNYGKVAVEAIDRATAQMGAENTVDAKYKRAKYRVIFFLNGCITLFWVIVLLHLVALVVALIVIIVR